MELKTELTKILDRVNETAENIKDAASEVVHRVAAEAEQQKRNVSGDFMTTDDKASSMINQAKQTAQGDVDAMKREARNKA